MPLRFIPAELKTIHNSEFFYIKASVSKKIDALLAEVRDEIKSVIEKEKIKFPEEVDARMGKIFRGENYSGLPYLVLDFPKHFSKDSVLAFRTMFWWGNFFSFTMHLQGKALEEKRKALIENWRLFRKKNIYISTGKTPWHYHYKKDNYRLIDTFSEQDIKHLFITKEFIKFSRKIPLKDYKKLNAFIKESFTLFSSSLFSR